MGLPTRVSPRKVPTDTSREEEGGTKKIAAEVTVVVAKELVRSFAMPLMTDEKNNEQIAPCRQLRCEHFIMDPLRIILNPAGMIGNPEISRLTLRWNCLLCNCHTCLALLRLLRSRNYYDREGIGWTHQLMIHETPIVSRKHL